MDIPKIIYGTAWKEKDTSSLVKKAVHAGYTAIDTANQKKHYREDYLGDALLELQGKGVQRETLFLQSKFTYVSSQDHRLPYDPKDSFEKQVLSSFESSLKNLHTDYLDSYLLHGPSSHASLEKADWEVWRTMESLQKANRARRIGVSNVRLHQLEELFKKAEIMPSMVQNRCFARFEWDRGVREFCLSHQIAYQGFSLLTANPQVLSDPRTLSIAHRLGVTPQQVVFRFAIHMGILPITGTTSEIHMSQDLQAFQLELTESDIHTISSIR